MINKFSGVQILIGLLVIHLLVVGINWFLLKQTKNNILSDGQYINMIGQIRGSIQRSSKLALSQNSFKQSEELITKNFQFLKNNLPISFDEESNQVLSQLELKWEELNPLLHSCSKDINYCNQTLLILSEDIWIKADKVAKVLENNSKNKMDDFNKIFIVFLLEIVLVFFIVYKLLVMAQSNIKNERAMLQQSRLAQMGELMSMIAHQWRQPLASISVIVIRMKTMYELNKYNCDTEENIKEFRDASIEAYNKVEELVQNLSQTINDFRTFYKPNKFKDEAYIYDVFKSAFNIIEHNLAIHRVNVIYDIEHEHNLKKMYKNEMMQVILSILTNSLDNFIEQRTHTRTINVFIRENSISICDSGGGIPENIINKIFDPYFSTKHQKNGTGIGLYMSKTIIENHHTGKLVAYNKDDGVCFEITLNID